VSRKRVLTDAQCQDLEAWYSNFQRIGTVDEKCREVGISEDTFRDAIRRVRGETPRPLRRKLSEAEINQLADDISRGTPETA
jgi:cytochrome c553